MGNEELGRVFIGSSHNPKPPTSMFLFTELDVIDVHETRRIIDLLSRGMPEAFCKALQLAHFHNASTNYV